MRFAKSCRVIMAVFVSQILVLFVCSSARAQSNRVPVGTTGNRYVLSIQNRFPWTFDSVHVEVLSSPSWMTFESPEVVIDSIRPGESKDASFGFDVADVQAGTTDSVKVLISDCLGEGIEVRTVAFTAEMPQSVTELDGAYPNPSNPSTTIRYSLNGSGRVTLIVYDILGRQVRTLVNSEMSPGHHSVVWNGMDDHGNTVASGVYLVRFVAAGNFGARQSTSKILMLK